MGLRLTQGGVRSGFGNACGQLGHACFDALERNLEPVRHLVAQRTRVAAHGGKAVLQLVERVRLAAVGFGNLADDGVQQSLEVVGLATGTSGGL